MTHRSTPPGPKRPAGLTRRALAASLAAPVLLGIPALPWMSSRLFAADVEILIVGAGAAGIAAARECMRRGVSFRLIEARSRIGGRAFTDASLGPAFDAGAEIIHFADRNPWLEIARELGEPLDMSGGRFGGWQPYSHGRPLPPQERSRRWQAFRTLEARQEDVVRSGVDKSVAEAVSDLDPDLRAVAQSGLLLVLGEDGERISIIDNQTLWDGPDYTTRNGYGSLVAAHGVGVPVTLSTPVTAIDWSGGGVLATTPAGELRARAAIITVSVGVLRAGGIRFTPDLPAQTRGAIDGIGMGALTKIAVGVEGERFGLAESTFVVDVSRAAATTMIEMFPRGQPLAVAIVGGDFARALCEAGEAAAVEHVSATLASIFGSRARAALRGGRLAAWWTDPLSRGAYSVARPGMAASRAVLQRHVGGRLWFAGEATGEGGAMTVGGATIAGRRAAGEAIRLLRG